MDDVVVEGVQGHQDDGFEYLAFLQMHDAAADYVDVQGLVILVQGLLPVLSAPQHLQRRSAKLVEYAGAFVVP